MQNGSTFYVLRSTFYVLRSSFDVLRTSFAVLFVIALTAGSAAAQQAQPQSQPFEPQVGQPGKDVVWVPT